MAFEITIEDNKWGIPLPEAYVRVVPERLYTDSNQVGFSFEIYVSAAAREAGKKPLGGVEIVGAQRASYDSSLPDVAKQLYDQVKAATDKWTDFKDAKDV
jgi:hypothetical protein